MLMRIKRYKIFIIWFFIPILLLFACNFNASAPTGSPDLSSSKTIRVGYLPLLSAYPLYTAIEKRYFEEEGLNVELRTIKSGPEGNEALAANNIDVAFSILPSLVVARSKGIPGDLVSIYGASIDSSDIKDHRIILPKNSTISSIENLRGKKVAVVGYPGKTSDVLELLDYLNRNGLTEKDVQLVGMGHADQVAALESGTVDAAACAEPYVTLGLLENRVKVFPIRDGYYYSRDEATEVTTYLARQGWIDTNKEIANKFISALEKGLKKAEDREWLFNKGLPSFNNESEPPITFVKLTSEQSKELHLPKVNSLPTESALQYISEQLVRHGPLKQAPKDFSSMIYKP